MSGFLAFEFPCLQYIPRIALRFISPSSSHCTRLPVENTLGGSHCLLNYIHLHSSISCPPSAPCRLLIPLIAPFLSLTAGTKSWMFFQFHTSLRALPYPSFFTVSQGCPGTPQPMCILSASFCRNACFQGWSRAAELSSHGLATRGEQIAPVLSEDSTMDRGTSLIPPCLTFP